MTVEQRAALLGEVAVTNAAIQSPSLDAIADAAEEETDHDVLVGAHECGYQDGFNFVELWAHRDA